MRWILNTFLCEEAEHDNLNKNPVKLVTQTSCNDKARLIPLHGTYLNDIFL